MTACLPDGLIAALQHPDVAERIYAAEDLGHTGEPAAVPLLVSRLSLESERPVREAIFVALSRLPPAAVVPAATRLLRSEDAHIRNQAVELLRTHCASAGEALAACIRDHDQDLRKFAVDALTNMGATATALIAVALDDPEANVRIAAVEAVGNLHLGTLRGHVETIAITSALETPMLLVACLHSLAELGHPDSIVVARAIPPSTCPRYLLAALLRLFECTGQPEDAAALVELLDPARCPQARHAIHAVRAIQRRHPARALPACVQTALEALRHGPWSSLFQPGTPSEPQHP